MMALATAAMGFSASRNQCYQTAFQGETKVVMLAVLPGKILNRRLIGKFFQPCFLSGRFNVTKIGSRGMRSITAFT